MGVLSISRAMKKALGILLMISLTVLHLTQALRRGVNK